MRRLSRACRAAQSAREMLRAEGQVLLWSRAMAGGDLSITALYTCQTWQWANFGGAELLASSRSQQVFDATNAALWLARRLRPELPSLPHSLAQRHAILDALVAQAGCSRVLELAAGLSRRGATVSADPHFDYVEVDLASVVQQKRALLQRSAAGRAVLERPNLRLVSGDVAAIDLEALVPGAAPACVVAEGLLMYLDAAAQRALWTRLATLLRARPGSWFVFDLVPAIEQPQPGVVGRVLDRLFQRFTGGARFAFDHRGRSALVNELHAAGFAEVELFEPHMAPADWQLPFLDQPTQTLVFACRA